MASYGGNAAVTLIGLPQRSVLTDEVYQAVHSMILERQIEPGAPVSIDALARDLDVSQTPVREALARLEADGLVTKVPLRGYRATPLLTAAQFDDMFQFRGLIEPWAAARAAKNLDDELASALKAELESASALENLTFYGPYIEHDTRFHSLIVGHSGSWSVEEAFTRLHCHLHLFRLYNSSQKLGGDEEGAAFVRELFDTYYGTGDDVLAVVEHKAIADAILRGDSVAASAAMGSHVEASRQRFGPAMQVLNELP